jgi:hypothetical protein
MLPSCVHLKIAMLISSMPLSLTIVSGLPRAAMMASISSAARA